MKHKIICKTLAVAVILLFIGLGVKPVIADTPDIIDNIKNKKDWEYQEHVPIIRLIILQIGMAVVFSLMEKLPDNDKPIILMLQFVFILIYAFLGARFLYLSGWTP